MVDAIHSKCIDVSHEGSSPSLPSKNLIYRIVFLSDKLSIKRITANKIL